MAVIAYPQGLTALLARLLQRGQRHYVRRFGTRGAGSSDHGCSPAALFILLLSSLQATPAVKLCFPFRFFAERQTSLEQASFNGSQISSRVFAKTPLLPTGFFLLL